MSVRLVVVAEAIEQGLQPVNVIGRGGNVRAHVPAKTLVDLAIVIAVAAGVELHHQAVLHAHARHLGQHLGTKQLLFGGVGLARNHPVEQRRRCGRGRSAVFAVGCPWSVAVQPSFLKRSRAWRSASR